MITVEEKTRSSCAVATVLMASQVSWVSEEWETITADLRKPVDFLNVISYLKALVESKSAVFAVEFFTFWLSAVSQCVFPWFFEISLLLFPLICIILATVLVSGVYFAFELREKNIRGLHLLSVSSLIVASKFLFAAVLKDFVVQVRN
jgi:hypothetical protein